MNISLDKDFIYEYKLQCYIIEKNEDALEEACFSFLGTKKIIIQEQGETFQIINNLN